MRSIAQIQLKHILAVNLMALPAKPQNKDRIAWQCVYGEVLGRATTQTQPREARTRGWQQPAAELIVSRSCLRVLALPVLALCEGAPPALCPRCGRGKLKPKLKATDIGVIEVKKGESKTESRCVVLLRELAELLLTPHRALLTLVRFAVGVTKWTCPGFFDGQEQICANAPKVQPGGQDAAIGLLTHSGSLLVCLLFSSFAEEADALSFCNKAFTDKELHPIPFKNHEHITVGTERPVAQAQPKAQRYRSEPEESSSLTFAFALLCFVAAR